MVINVLLIDIKCLAWVVGISMINVYIDVYVGVFKGEL